MNDRDRDLIIALIEGSLSEADAEAASARLASDPEFSAEYDIQRTIHEALAAVDPVAMTTEERTGLRANLIDELNLEEAAPVVVAPSRSRAPSWWMKPALAFGSVAAVFIIGVAVVPSMFSSSDDSAMQLTAAQLTTTTVEASAGADASDGGGEASETTTGDFAEEELLLEVPELRSTNIDEMLDTVEGETDDDAIAEGLEPFAFSQSSFTVSRDDIEACREQLGRALPDGDLQVIGATREASGAIVVTVAFSNSKGVDGFATIDLSTCVLVDLAE